MSDNSLKTSQLPSTNGMVSTDKVLIVYNASANASVASGGVTTRTISLSNFSSSLFNNPILNGPYANDSVAATSNVSIGSVYYDTSGLLRVRIS